MAQILIPQLVFSTRAPKPQVGSEFSREVVARSPGIDHRLIARFTEIADLTFSTRHQNPLEPVCSLEAAGDGEHWLACRFSSLGTYRKTSHHMLVHGLVLNEQSALALRANPFVLGHLTRLGLWTLEGHPGSGPVELPFLEADADDLHHRARQWEADRLAQLQPQLSPLDEPFLGLWEWTLEPGSATAVVLGDDAPDGRLLEWLLLHLHPADRLEKSLHTGPFYERARGYDLMMLRGQDLRIHRQTREKLRAWPEDHDGGSGGGLAELTQQLRLQRPEIFHRVLDRYRVTHLSERHLDPLAADEAAMVLAQALDAPLNPDQQARLRLLGKRGGLPLLYHVEELATLWDSPGDGFWQEVQRRSGDPQLWSGGLPAFDDALQAVAGHAVASWCLWTLVWAVQDDMEQEPGPRQSLRAELPDRLRRHWPVSSLEDMLDLCLQDVHRLPLVSRALWDLALIEAADSMHRRRLDPEAAADPYLGAVLTRLAALNEPVVAKGATLERAIVAFAESWADDDARRVALEEFESLENLFFRLDQRIFALKIRLRRRAPSLAPAARQDLLRRTLDEILAGDGGDDAALRSPLNHSDLGPPLWQGIQTWLLEDSRASTQSVDSRLRRWAVLCRRLQGALEPEQGEACGRLLAAAAFSPRYLELAPIFAGLRQAGSDAFSEPGDDGSAGQSFRDRLWRAVDRDILHRMGTDGFGDESRWAQGTEGWLRLHGSLNDADRDLLDWVLAGRLPALLVAVRQTGYREPWSSPEASESGEANDGSIQRPLARWLETLIAEGRVERVLGTYGNPIHWCNLMLDLLSSAPGPVPLQDDPRFVALDHLSQWLRSPGSKEKGGRPDQKLRGLSAA